MPNFFPNLPFTLGAPSMVYGEDLLENAAILSGLLDTVEIVLFHTPVQNNLPSSTEIRELKAIGDKKGTAFTVHLPASLELAAEEEGQRRASLAIALEAIRRFSPLHPGHYILHLPFSKPTLVPDPDLYYPWKPTRAWAHWEKRALPSLHKIREVLEARDSLLIENINYSPRFLAPFLDAGICRLCLDLGHLLLGREEVRPNLEYFFDKTAEIHLHGVDGRREHLSLSKMPFEQVQTIVDFLQQKPFQGLVNLEVFSPTDLHESLSLVTQAAI